MKYKIAFLKIPPWTKAARFRAKYHKESLHDDNQGVLPGFKPLESLKKTEASYTSMGARVVQDILERAGYTVGECTIEEAPSKDLVLLPILSHYDMYSFYRSVARRDEWQPGRRTFKVLAGGFGLANPVVLRNFVDFAAFGRVDDFLVDTVKGILEHGDFEHESVMRLPNIHAVKMGVQSKLYPYEVNGWREIFTGCVRRCKFCAFSYTRTHMEIPTKDSSRWGSTLLPTPEITWDQLKTYPQKLGMLVTALDGFSERIRFAVQKRITREQLIDGIEYVGRRPPITANSKNSVFMRVLNISNMPTETEEDREELYEILRTVRPKYRVSFVLHSTPFSPQTGTPMQWEPFTLFPDWSVVCKPENREIVETPTFCAQHSRAMGGPLRHVMQAIIERATPDNDADKAFHSICFDPKVKNGKAAENFEALTKLVDLDPFIRRYELDEKLPNWFLEGPVSREKLRTLAQVMRNKLADG